MRGMPRRSTHRGPATTKWEEANKAGLKGWSRDRFDLSGMLRFQVTT